MYRPLPSAGSFLPLVGPPRNHLDTCLSSRWSSCQVLDLCFWQHEYSAGIGATGRGVGAVGVLPSDGAVHLSAVVGGVERTGRTLLRPTPRGCRYMRVHRPLDQMGQVTHDADSMMLVAHFCTRLPSDYPCRFSYPEHASRNFPRIV